MRITTRDSLRNGRWSGAPLIFEASAVLMTMSQRANQIDQNPYREDSLKLAAGYASINFNSFHRFKQSWAGVIFRF